MSCTRLAWLETKVLETWQHKDDDMTESVVDSNTINIEIDGQTYEGRPGQMLIEVADAAGIPIPRFCYHKKLSVAANCRMCLVEVDQVAKPLPACATPINDGMKVFTKSPKAIQAQQGTLEFLLINHPLDCPICDQGGECPLQEVSMGYGRTESRYHEPKRSVESKDIGPLIATEMTRCIHCTLCVRFGDEIAGVREMGATGRGENVKIGTYIEHAIGSELSGNIIDLCPVGALTSKPFRFKARPWELINHEGVAPHDCVGSNIQIGTLRNRVLRVIPKENEEINEIWLSDRDRFSYEAVNGADRARYPMMNVDGAWHRVSWEEALEACVNRLQDVIGRYGAEQIGMLMSPNATLEEHYLAHLLMHGLGSSNVDSRIRQLDFSNEPSKDSVPWLGMPIAELEKLGAVLLVGSDISKEQPLLSNRIRKAVKNGAKVSILSAVKGEYRFDLFREMLASPKRMIDQLAAIIRVLLDTTGESIELGDLQQLVNASSPSQVHQDIAMSLKNSEHSAILLGPLALHHPRASVLRALAGLVEKLSGAKVGILPHGANTTGAQLARNAVNGGNEMRKGLNARSMLEQGLAAYMVFDLEPEYDCSRPSTALTALADAEFVVVFSAFHSEAVQRYADLILPIAPFTENAGTLVNIEGRWQSFSAAVTPDDEVKQAWKVFRVLGNLFQLDGFGYVSSSDVLQEVRERLGNYRLDNTTDPFIGVNPTRMSDEPSVVRVDSIPIYRCDPVVRRAEHLQQTPEAQRPCVVTVNLATAERLEIEGKREVTLRCKGNKVTLPLQISESVADDCIHIPAASEQETLLPAAFDSIEIS